MTDMQNKEISSSVLELPLVAAQPGIWMAEQLTGRRGGFTVAHYVEFHSEPNKALFDEAVRRGLADADMVHTRFGENKYGEPVQYLYSGIKPEAVTPPEWLDFSSESDSEARAVKWMNSEKYSTVQC